MNRFLQILSIALAFTLVSADISVTHPVEEVWRAGTQNAITWIEATGGAATPAKFNIYLMYGDATHLEEVATIATNVASTAASYNWFIAAVTKPGPEYAIRIGEGANAKYSHYFTIDNPALPSMTKKAGLPAPTGSAPGSSVNGTASANGSTDTGDKKNGAFRVGAGIVGAVGVITSFLLM